MKLLLMAVASGWLVAGAAHAEVTDRSAAGFEVKQTATIAAPQAKVYAALLKPSLWWNSAHSFSGDARNLTLDPVGGCFCETLPKGGIVRHMTVLYADGASQLRMAGALGPLMFTGADGHLGFALKDAAGKTELTLNYDVGGYAKGGLAEKWADPVDKVLGEQVGRLKRYLETGKAD